MDGYGLRSSDRWGQAAPLGGNLNTGTLTDIRLAEEVFDVCVVFPSTVGRRIKKKVCNCGSWSLGADIYTVIGSSFIGTGTHILPDTSPSLLRGVQQTKSQLSPWYIPHVSGCFASKQCSRGKTKLWEASKDLKANLATVFSVCNPEGEEESKQIHSLKFKSQWLRLELWRWHESVQITSWFRS